MPVNTYIAGFAKLYSRFRQAVLKAKHLIVQVEYTCITHINWGGGRGEGGGGGGLV